MQPAYPIYPPVMLRLLPRILWANAFQKRRSFRQDALRVAARLQPALCVLGQEHIPTDGPGLVLCNHYYRPGFEAYWIAFAISAVLPVEVQWVMTMERRYEHIRLGMARRAVEKVGLRAIARVYDFFSMPAMPPRPDEVEQRAHTVRQIIRRARSAPPAVIGLAPEGRDILSGTLGEPPPGVGRLIGYLHRLGFTLHPVGVFESEGRLCVRFGAPFLLDLPAGATSGQIDRDASAQTMRAIAALLPAAWRGKFE